VDARAIADTRESGVSAGRGRAGPGRRRRSSRGGSCKEVEADGGGTSGGRGALAARHAPDEAILLIWNEGEGLWVMLLGSTVCISCVIFRVGMYTSY
jgi:hypothetical protein